MHIACSAVAHAHAEKTPVAGRTLHGLLIQMQNISLRSSGMRRKQDFGFKSDTAVLTFPFRFLASFFFSCWAFSRLHFDEKTF